MSQLSGIRACVFDAYGTVFDFASAAARCSDIPEDRRAALTCLDQSVMQNPRIAFNAGSLTDSIILTMTDYLAVAKPSRVFEFSTATS